MLDFTCGLTGLSSAEDPHTKQMKTQLLERLGLPVYVCV